MREVYEQVILICTTINVIIIFACIIWRITAKINDRRLEKKDKQEKDKTEE